MRKVRLVDVKIFFRKLLDGNVKFPTKCVHINSRALSATFGKIWLYIGLLKVSFERRFVDDIELHFYWCGCGLLCGCVVVAYILMTAV